MPIYEYKCQKCGDIFDVPQKFADEPLKRHDGCGGDVERLISVPALQFKGSGFYVNDYAKGSNGSTKSSEKTNDKSGDKNGEKKTDSTTKTEMKSSDSSSTSSTPAKSDSK